MLDKVAAGGDMSKAPRGELRKHIKNFLLPNVAGYAVREAAIYEIGGKSKSSFYPLSDDSKTNRNLKLKVLRNHGEAVDKSIRLASSKAVAVAA